MAAAATNDPLDGPPCNKCDKPHETDSCPYYPISCRKCQGGHKTSLCPTVCGFCGGPHLNSNCPSHCEKCGGRHLTSNCSPIVVQGTATASTETGTETATATIPVDLIAGKSIVLKVAWGSEKVPAEISQPGKQISVTRTRDDVCSCCRQKPCHRCSSSCYCPAYAATITFQAPGCEPITVKKSPF